MAPSDIHAGLGRVDPFEHAHTILRVDPLGHASEAAQSEFVQTCTDFAADVWEGRAAVEGPGEGEEGQIQEAPVTTLSKGPPSRHSAVLPARQHWIYVLCQQRLHLFDLVHDLAYELHAC